MKLLKNAAALAALAFSPSSIVGFSIPASISTSATKALRTRTSLDTIADLNSKTSIDVHTPSITALYSSSLSDADKAESTSSSSTSTSTSHQGEEEILSTFQSPTSSKILSDPIPYSQLTIGVMKETFKGENRVSITPDSAETLVKAGFHVVVQSGAGANASFSDAAYVDKGAIVLPGDDFYANADIFAKIRPPSEEEVPKLAGKTLVGMISPSLNKELYEDLAEQNTNVFALDCVPRMLSRAQAYDVLSSQANIAGYRAMIEAAEAFPRFFAGQMTAAGKVPPAKVLVIGVGEFSSLR
jgi:hypothetical protein